LREKSFRRIAPDWERGENRGAAAHPIRGGAADYSLVKLMSPSAALPAAWGARIRSVMESKTVIWLSQMSSLRARFAWNYR
jgi:hypothetical protein